MTAHRNPFEYVAANDLSTDMILDYYIEDFNYSRFIQSKRNILLVGERGCGKSMALLYNSWEIQRLRAERENETPGLDLIGVYVPCNTPLTHKMEYQLLPEFPAAVISEHFLVLSLTYAIARTLAEIPDVLDGADEESLRSQVEFIFGTELPGDVAFFHGIQQFIQKELLRTQRAINDRDTPEVHYENTFSFASVVVPILGSTRTIPRLRNSHIMLLIDDAHDLNPHQFHALNSWIAYRDHSLFSFKVALASLPASPLRTTSGGSILEAHDYTRLDMVQAYHNEASNFGQFAKRLIGRRLQKFGIQIPPDDFFPISPQLQSDLAKAEEVVRQEAVEKYGDDSRKISDFVYKYKRAQYFRNRSPKANRPEYSGFDTLVFLSTGIVRNLLVPPYWMYDKIVSLGGENGSQPTQIQGIPPNIQSEIILERSRQLWDWLRLGLDQNIEGCSRQEAQEAYQLLDNLAIHFRERLLKHRSEPRANSFTISGQTEQLMANLNRLFRVLQEAQLLYVRSGSAKDRGRRELYYVPNRMLWPDRGLDPHGQHARVSLSATALWAAATQNKPIPLEPETTGQQSRLFDE